jgi:hypothetical protein
VQHCEVHLRVFVQYQIHEGRDKAMMLELMATVEFEVLRVDQVLVRQIAEQCLSIVD